MRGITEVIYVTGLGKTPAATNRKTGVVYLNADKWDKIKPEHKLYILLHELGHIYHDTSNEFLADQFAFEQYTKLGYSLTQAVYALSSVLTLTTDEHFERIEKQLVRALNYDATINQNDKAENILSQLQMENLDNFRGKRKTKSNTAKAPIKGPKKVARAARKAAVVLPPVATVRGAKAIKKAVVKKREQKRLAKTPTRVFSSPVTPVSNTESDTRFVDPITTTPVLPPATKLPAPAPMDNWKQPEEIEEEIVHTPMEEEYEEEIEILEDDSIDEFMKKVGKGIKRGLRKIGDAAAPLADVGISTLPGGNALVSIRKNAVKNAKAKNQKPTATPGIVQQPAQAPRQNDVQKPATDKPKNTKTFILIGIVLLVIAVLAYFLLSKKK